MMVATDKGPVEARITYEHGEQLILALWTTRQIEEVVIGLTIKRSGFYGFTEPGETFPRVTINREGILFIQIFGTPDDSEVK